MRFGNDETTALIKKYITDETNIEWQKELLAIVEKDADRILKSTIDGKRGSVNDSRDREDIILEVQLTVLKVLPQYYKKISQFNEKQRNAWLRKIVESRISDYFKVCAHKVRKDISLDALLHMSDETSTSIEMRLENRLVLQEVVKILGEIKTTPDKCLAFLLLLLSSVSEAGNGRPQIIAEEMNGRLMIDVFDEVKERLNRLLGGGLDDILEPLHKRTLSEASQKFQFNARAITYNANWIKTKIRSEYKQRSNL